MDLSLIAQKALGATEMFIRRNAPTILTGTGIAGFAVTTVLVGKAVLKAQDDLDLLRIQGGHIKKKEVTEDYSREDKIKEIGDLYLRVGLEIGKIFAPSIAVGGLSITCILVSHGMMQKRQAGILAAYATLDAGFKAYRKRVEDELGAEKELDFYRGVLSTKEVQEIGEDHCVINEYSDKIPSPYARFFDESSPNWTKTPEYNLMFLRSQQEYANNRLRAHGFVFLNEVYESLGLERTQVGQVVGWKLNGDGDNFIDFGLYAIGDECNRAFINGIEHTVLLDFNVDGPIKI